MDDGPRISAATDSRGERMDIDAGFSDDGFLSLVLHMIDSRLMFHVTQYPYMINKIGVMLYQKGLYCLYGQEASGSASCTVNVTVMMAVRTSVQSPSL